MATPTQPGAAPAIRRGAPPAAEHPMEGFVFRVGCRALLLSAAAMIYALAGDSLPVSPSHVVLLFLLWALGLGLVHASPVLRRLPRSAATAAGAAAGALHRLF